MKRTEKKGISKCVVAAFAIVASLTVLSLKGGNAAIPPDAGYKGLKNCKMCHSDKHEVWAKTGHARAYDLLVAVGKQSAKECLPCHTTGFGKKGGYVDETTTPDLKGVQCESCHGPGDKHNGNPEAIEKNVMGKTCGECHMAMNIH